MTIKSNKKLIIVSITILSIICVSCLLSLLCVYVINNTCCKNNEKVDAWSGGGTSSNPYRISTKADLETLSSNVAGGNSYSGVHFIVTNDIDCYGREGRRYWNTDLNSIGYNASKNSIHPFRGNFNGNGYKIEGLNMISQGWYSSSPEASPPILNGFFACLGDGAVISQLYLDIVIKVPSSGAMVGSCIGGVAGCYSGNGSATINNCRVLVDVTKSSTVIADGDKHIGGIVGGIEGKGKLNITNCYVDNLIVRLGGESYYTNYSIGGIDGGSHLFGATCSVGYCVVEKTNITTSDSSKTTKYAIAPTHTNSYSSNKNDGFKNLSPTAKGGDSGSTWYYYADYKAWPVLRLFITKQIGWKEVSFTAVGGSAPDPIYIPQDANETYTSTSESIKIYGQTVTATNSNCHYASVSWTANSPTSYTVIFKKPSRSIIVKIKNESGSLLQWLSYSISCGSALSISTKTHESSTRYKECTISGKTYEPSEDYYIKSISHTNGTIVHADTTIIIEIAKNDYGLIII